MFSAPGNSFADYYAAGCLLIGILLILDNLVLMRRGGRFYAAPSGKTLGWSRFVMLVGSGWMGASVLALVLSNRPLLPILYLALCAMGIYAGVIERRAKGVVLSVPPWFLRGALIASIAFTLVAVQALTG